MSKNIDNMKKIIFIIFLSFCFIYNAKASDTFYLGDHVPDIYIYMNRINKKVYRQFRMIYKTGSNELVYCIEPGETLSTGEYENYRDFENKFNISMDKWEKIKLIAYYGYNYQNHTDIKWYAITQYIIWKEVMPSSWEMYFVDENHNKLDNLYLDEINEIYSLVNSHIDNPGIQGSYIVNLTKKTTLVGNNNLQNYNVSSGTIEYNRLYLDNLNVGINHYSLTYKNYKAPLFYYNSGGQNIFKRGDLLKQNINFSVYVYAGKVKINECNEENFNYDFIGGTYEVLSQDDEILDTFTCVDSNCISNYLPIGYHKIRVKNLGNYFEENEHIYDVQVRDAEVSEIDICSLPRKKEPIRNVIPDEEPEEILEEKSEDPVEPEESEEVVEEFVETTELMAINEEPEENEDVITIPYTMKNTYFKYIFLFPLLFCFIKIKKLNENNN